MPEAPYKDLGPCEILWDPSGDNENLSPFFGGVKFRDSLIHKDIFEDGHGEAPVDGVTMGRTVEVEAIMTRSDITQLEIVIAGSVKSGAGSGTTLRVSNTAGVPMLASAKELRIKPMQDNVASADSTEWIYVWRAYPVIDQEITFDTSGQRVSKVLFKCFPDDTTGRVGEFYRDGPA